MARTADATIPGDEPLYRSVAKDHVDDGLVVLATAVEVPACSFNRSKYSSPEDVLVPSRPSDNGILVVTPGELPPPIPRSEEAPYEFFAADDPCPKEDPANEAHCEVRIRRQGQEYNKNLKLKPKPEMALKAREALARAMRIHRTPT
jgi:hypothetical protein